MVNNERERDKISMKTETFRFSYDFQNYTSNLMILHFEKHSQSMEQKRSKNHRVWWKAKCCLECVSVFLFLSVFSSFRVNVFNMYSEWPWYYFQKKIMVLPNRISMFKWIYSVQIDMVNTENGCVSYYYIVRISFCCCCCCPQFVRKAQCQSAPLPFQPVHDCRSNVQW